MNILEVFEKLVVEYKLLLNVEKSLFALPQVAWLLFIDEVGKLIGFWCQVSSGCWTPKLLKSVDFFHSYSKKITRVQFSFEKHYILIKNAYDSFFITAYYCVGLVFNTAAVFNHNKFCLYLLTPSNMFYMKAGSF